MTVIDWFDALDDENRPLLTEREILRNLQTIINDADNTPINEVSPAPRPPSTLTLKPSSSQVARTAIGVLSTENRKTWSRLRASLSNDRHNASCLNVVDDALFIVCLDDAAPANLAELCSNFLCGTYDLRGGVQVGTCTNRWYDKVSLFLNIDIYITDRY